MENGGKSERKDRVSVFVAKVSFFEKACKATKLIYLEFSDSNSQE